MFVVEVMPVARGVFKEKLSYFSARAPAVGTLIKAPLRKKTVPALVIAVEPARDNKLKIKSAGFGLKKISPETIKNFLRPEFVETVREAANFFAAAGGLVLNAVLPQTILKNCQKIESKKNPGRAPLGGRAEKLALQAGDEDRFSHYRSLIREEFAKNSSLLLLVPSLEEGRRVKDALEKGIERFTFLLHSAWRPAELVKNWNQAVAVNHPVLIIATPIFLSLPRLDLGLIIIERENSPAYRELRRPFVDWRIFAEIFSRKIGCRLLFADVLLRTETVWRQKNLELAEFAPLRLRLGTGADCRLAVLPKKSPGQPLKALSPELKTFIAEALKNHQQILVFGSRKGLYPITVCGDCGQLVTCGRCSAPAVLHLIERQRVFICHKCGAKQPADRKCRRCGGWRLETLGIGLELIEQEIKKEFPESRIFRLDRSAAKSDNAARAIVSKFLEKPGVLVGSELALLYLNQKIDRVAVAGADSLFFIPDFRIAERLMSVLLRLRDRANQSFLIQTRQPEQSVWRHALTGNLAEFYREEISERQNFGYPPFSLLIKITLSGERKAVEQEMKRLADYLKDFQPLIYPAFIQRIKNRFLMQALIKEQPANWPNKKLLEKLRALPPKFMIKVDPENIL